MTERPESVTVLLVEDNSIEVKAIRRAFDKQRIANPIVVAQDGLEALELLRGAGDRNPVPRPFLILLDLNLPRMGGIEFLQELRNDEHLMNSIVFVLTTSDDEKDRVQAYQLHVSGYLLKSNFEDGFVNLVSMLDHYWRYVEFPPEVGRGRSPTQGS